MKERISTHKPKADALKAKVYRFLDGTGSSLFLSERGGRRTLSIVQANLKRGRARSKIERKAIRMQVDSNHNIPR